MIALPEVGVLGLLQYRRGAESVADGGSCGRGYTVHSRNQYGALFDGGGPHTDSSLGSDIPCKLTFMRCPSSGAT